jgi:hypothetical protein
MDGPLNENIENNPMQSSTDRPFERSRKNILTRRAGFIPELGVEIHKRGGLYYYDRIARGFQDGALGGGVGFGDSGAVARGHTHWKDQDESKGDLNNADAYSQKAPDYKTWVGSWYGSRLYWHEGKPTEPRMPDWNRYKY